MGYSVRELTVFALILSRPTFPDLFPLFFLERENGGCPAHLLWPGKSHLILGLSHIGGNHRAVAWLLEIHRFSMAKYFLPPLKAPST